MLGVARGNMNISLWLMQSLDHGRHQNCEGVDSQVGFDVCNKSDQARKMVYVGVKTKITIIGLTILRIISW